MYKDPWGNQVRALERNIIKYRSMEMILVVHYVEELKRFIITGTKSRDDFDRRYNKDNPKQRIGSNCKNEFYASLKAWHEDELISRDEKKDLAELTGYRNDIAHRVHELTADLSNEKYICEMVSMIPDHFSSYQYGAVKKLKKYSAELPERYHQKFRVGFIDMKHAMFRTAEAVLVSELKSLRKKIDRLYLKRRKETKSLNSELNRIHETFIKEKSPSWVFQTYDDGRFTPRGEEICYRLFDEGFSNLAISYSFGILLTSIRNRRTMWEKIGGRDRSKICFDELPIRRSPPKYYD